ncbi:MAG: GAF domain-containing protein [Anaerolineae bacterium]|nr:GAF domain-containing protein [Anaerolineae bacterium]
MAQVVREHGYSPKGVDAALLRFPVDRTATLRRMAESRRPLVISDVERCEEWVSVPEEHWIRSYAGAPIFIRSYAGAPMFFQERLIGFLSLDSATPGAFTDIDGERLQAFADQAAIAIENAHLYGGEPGPQPTTGAPEPDHARQHRHARHQPAAARAGGHRSGHHRRRRLLYHPLGC